MGADQVDKLLEREARVHVCVPIYIVDYKCDDVYLRFWYQVFTWVSVSPSLAANSSRS